MTTCLGAATAGTPVSSMLPAVLSHADGQPAAAAAAAATHASPGSSNFGACQQMTTPTAVGQCPSDDGW